MSLTSYRTAPPRGAIFGLRRRRRHPPAWLSSRLAAVRAAVWPCEANRLRDHCPVDTKAAARVARQRPLITMRMGSQITLASKPGGDLLFHCLSNSTIGAVWFHGRVRDGIGWVTDAMATKLWGQRVRVSRNRAIRP